MALSTNNGWKTLAAAIISQSVHDKQKAASSLKQNPENTECILTVEEVDRFALSTWFEDLCALGDVDCQKTRKKILEVKDYDK